MRSLLLGKIKRYHIYIYIYIWGCPINGLFTFIQKIFKMEAEEDRYSTIWDRVLYWACDEVLFVSVRSTDVVFLTMIVDGSKRFNKESILCILFPLKH